ncbi:hypothetical protein ACLESD_46935, partial [Pyxidicoccus sp. 3LFB2]
WPRSTSHAVFHAAAALANTLREGHDVLIPEAERFLPWFPGFERRVRAAPVPEGEASYHGDLLEHLQVEVRLMREYLDQKEEEQARAREAELRRVVEASRRRDMERQAEIRRQELERQKEAAWRDAERQQPAVHPPVVHAAALAAFTLRPQLPGRPLDDEVILPEARLRTLMDYVLLLKQLSGGGADVLAVFAAHGLTVESWTAECTAWGQALTGRLELGLRFGELMAAPWA